MLADLVFWAASLNANLGMGQDSFRIELYATGYKQARASVVAPH
jgi:hypothetical protein